MPESSVDFSINNVSGIFEGGPIRVLHVDDDAFFLKTAKTILEMHGAFQMDTALSVEEAVEKMKKEKYDAVVSDYLMPGKDGLRFLEELRQKGNSIPFIIFTGKGREEVVIKALNHGADHYENKNGNPEMIYSELSHDIINAVRTRRAEQELRVQREELQTILDSLPLQIWYKDKDNHLVRVNKRFADYMGVSKKDLEGKSLDDLFPPDIARKCWEEDKEVFTTGQPKTDILDRHESVQGVRWFSTGKVACREKDGNIIGTINFSVDITERKKIEEALGENMERYRTLTANIPGMVYRGALDWSTRIISNSEEVSGYLVEEFNCGKVNWLDIIHPDDKDRVLEEASRILEKQTRMIQEYRIIDKDGKIRFIEDHKNPLVSEEGVSEGVDGVVFDITERKKAEMALIESEKKYRALLHDSGQGIGYYDLQGNILLMNEKALGRLKKPKEEIVGKPACQVFGKNTGDMIVKRIGEIVTSEKPKAYEDFVELPTGKNWFLSTFSPIRSDKGKISGVQVISFDVSEKKKTEETLKESLEKLRVLSEKLGVVGKLTRHDVRNKLSAVIGNTYLATKTLPKDHKALAYLKGIELVCMQATKILDFAATFESLGAEELASVDVGKTFEEAASLFPGLHGAKIVNECHGLTVMADSLMRQLFYNLIDNSLKHGQKVSRINVRFEKRKDGLKLFYEDDGVGIPKLSKPKIFDMGFTTGNGLGYGLPLIKKMVEIYGWTIEEKGEPGKGAKFVIAIPEARVTATSSTTKTTK